MLVTINFLTAPTLAATAETRTGRPILGLIRIKNGNGRDVGVMSALLLGSAGPRASSFKYTGCFIDHPQPEPSNRDLPVFFCFCSNGTVNNGNECARDARIQPEAEHGCKGAAVFVP